MGRAAGNTARSLPQDIAVRPGSTDRLVVNLAEYRKGYHYLVSPHSLLTNKINLKFYGCRFIFIACIPMPDLATNSIHVTSIAVLGV